MPVSCLGPAAHGDRACQCWSRVAGERIKDSALAGGLLRPLLAHGPLVRPLALLI